MKLGLTTRGKWTSEHDVSQDVYIYIYIYICKSEVSKSYTTVNALYKPKFYYFDSCILLWNYTC